MYMYRYFVKSNQIVNSPHAANASERLANSGLNITSEGEKGAALGLHHCAENFIHEIVKELFVVPGHIAILGHLQCPQTQLHLLYPCPPPPAPWHFKHHVMTTFGWELISHSHSWLTTLYDHQQPYMYILSS